MPACKSAGPRRTCSSGVLGIRGGGQGRGCGSPSEENFTMREEKILLLPAPAAAAARALHPLLGTHVAPGYTHTHRHRRATAPASIHHSPPTHSSAQLTAHSYESTVIIALAQSQSRRGRSPTLPPCCPPAVAPGPRLSPGRAVSGRWGHARTHLTPETPSARCS